MNFTEVVFSIGLTIGGGFWGFYLNNILEKRYLPKIEKVIQEAISGTWNGIFHQDKNENRPEQEIPIIFKFKATPRMIKGTMLVEDINKYNFKVEGAYYRGIYLRLTYTGEKAIDFGSIFLFLAPRLDEMQGKIAGYGSISKTLISGNVQLEKVQNN